MMLQSLFLQVPQLVAASEYGLLDTHSTVSTSHQATLTALASHPPGATSALHARLPSEPTATQQRSIALQPPAKKLTAQQQNHLVKYMFGLLKASPVKILQPSQQQGNPEASPLSRVFQTAAPIHTARVQQIEANR